MTAVDFAAFVERLADAAAEAILPFFRTALEAEDKSRGGRFDPVTEADRAAETAMRGAIQAAFPAHGIVGEEFGSHQPDAPYQWVLDPIDGTKSFISGLPLWGTLIGLLHNGAPVYGMMAQPFTRERFVGDGTTASWRGPGADHSLGTRRLFVRPCADLAHAVLMTTSPLLIPPDKRRRYERVEAEVRLTRYGGDCYAYAMVAAGHVDCVIESGLQAYDIAALIPIIRGAGGVVTSWDGGSPDAGGDIVAAGDVRVHEAAMSLLAE
jgi:myo-inositol-1(or 4)-monophosphatase